MAVFVSGGGPVRPVAMDLNPISHMLVDSSRAYWLNERNGVGFQIMSAALRDGTPNAIWNTGTAVSHLVQDEQFLYWLTADPDSPAALKRARKDGTGMVTAVYELSAKSHALALQGTTLYWGGSDTGVWSGDTDGSQSMFVEQSRYLTGLVSLFANDTMVGWHKHWNDETKLWWWLPKERFMAGGGFSDYSMKYTYGGSIALDGVEVYFLQCGPEDCSLTTIDVESGDLARVIWRTNKLDRTSLIAVRGSYIFLTTGTVHPGKEQVMRIRNQTIAKP